MSQTNQVCICCEARDNCLHYDTRRTVCVPVQCTDWEHFSTIQDTTDWKHYRIQAAIAAMQGMIANPQTFEQLAHDKGYKEICGGDKLQIIAISSVMYADALVEELKRNDDVYAEARRHAAINTAAVCENMTKIQKELHKKGGEQ